MIQHPFIRICGILELLLLAALPLSNASDCKYSGCKNAGICVLLSAEVGLRICRCPEGFRGESCEIPAVTCGHGYCANRGVCSPRATCDCVGNFTGPTCEAPVEVCPFSEGVSACR
mmetsp:Transcript_15980/g.44590  ORF Transcript_15980/g.44590 Transcript_15980/m.44590 type:complete len:116 (+) Transcript_15980:303-650(+)